MAPLPRSARSEVQDKVLHDMLKEVGGPFYERVEKLAYEEKRYGEDKQDKFSDYYEKRKAVTEEFVKEKLGDLVKAKYNEKSGMIEIRVEWPDSREFGREDKSMADRALERAIMGGEFEGGKIPPSMVKVKAGTKPEDIGAMVEAAQKKATEIIGDYAMSRVADSAGRKRRERDHEETIKKMVAALPAEKQALYKTLDKQAKEALSERTMALRRIAWNKSYYMTPKELQAQADDEGVKKSAKDNPDYKDNPAGFAAAAVAQKKVYDAYDKLEALLLESATKEGMPKKDTVLAIFYARQTTYQVDYASGDRGDWETGKARAFPRPVLYDEPKGPAKDAAPEKPKPAAAPVPDRSDIGRLAAPSIPADVLAGLTTVSTRF